MRWQRQRRFLPWAHLDERKVFCFSDRLHLFQFSSSLFHGLLTGNSINEQCLGEKNVICLVLINLNSLAHNRVEKAFKSFQTREKKKKVMFSFPI